MRPGREHDITAACADPDLLEAITAWTADGRPGLADLGYHGEPDTLRRDRGCSWRIGGIVAAALVLRHHENHRTT